MPDGTAVQPITMADFAGKVRAKYPGAYDHLSDSQLTGKIITKYPEYKDQISGMAKTDFEKERTEGERGFIPAVERSMPGLFAGPNESDASKAGVSRFFDKAAPSSASPSFGDVAGLDARAMRDKADRGDTWGILGQAAVPLATAAAPLVGELAGAARQGMSRFKPGLMSAADAAIHPTEIPGKVIKAGIDWAIPNKPEFPGAPLPASEDFYANKAADLERRGRAQGALDRQAAREAKANAPEGSPENPGWVVKLPNRMPPENPLRTAGSNLSDRLVLSPEEWGAKDVIQDLATQRAKDRGMLFAGGWRPGKLRAAPPTAEPELQGNVSPFPAAQPLRVAPPKKFFDAAD